MVSHMKSTMEINKTKKNQQLIRLHNKSQLQSCLGFCKSILTYFNVEKIRHFFLLSETLCFSSAPLLENKMKKQNKLFALPSCEPVQVQSIVKRGEHNDRLRLYCWLPLGVHSYGSLCGNQRNVLSWILNTTPDQTGLDLFSTCEGQAEKQALCVAYRRHCQHDRSRVMFSVGEKIMPFVWI